MKEFILSIPMEPTPKGRPKFTRMGHAYTPEKTRSAEAEMRWHIEKHVKALTGTNSGVLIDGPCMVFLEFKCTRPASVRRQYPTTKPDLDNLIKGVFDAMNKRVFRDDSQVVDLRATKQYVSERPSISVTVIEVRTEKENRQMRKEPANGTKRMAGSKKEVHHRD